MNILFLTIGDFANLKGGSVHIDIVQTIAEKGHCVYVACKDESLEGEACRLEKISDNLTLLFIKTGSLKKKVNIIRKGFSTIMLEGKYLKAIKTYFRDIQFDLVLYHTPPVTFNKVIKYIKNKCGATSYLLLKDIFPQNAVDLGMMTRSGIKSIPYLYFRNKESTLYKLSDFIGCMSPANMEYILKHNNIDKTKVEIAPNSIILRHKRSLTVSEKSELRRKYSLPIDKPIFIYGGNLGKPQGIDYLLECLNINKTRNDCFFLIIGSGSEFHKIASWVENLKEKGKYPEICVKLMKGLPKEEYDSLVQACDVGLIFLDKRFTIPNYPSRLLSYMENRMPVICATDINTDIGKIAEENNYGYWCESKNPSDFTALVDKMLQSDIKMMGEKGYQFLCQNYLAEHTCQTIMNHFV